MANSATTVLPVPVGAATSTERPAARCSAASIWNGSSGNGWVARNAATASEGSESLRGARDEGDDDDERAPVFRGLPGRWTESPGGIVHSLFRCDIASADHFR